MLQNYFLKENWCELQWSSVLLVWLASDPHIWLEPCCMIHFALFSFQRTPADFHLLALTWVSFYILLHSAVFVKHFFEVFFKSRLPAKPAAEALPLHPGSCSPSLAAFRSLTTCIILHAFSPLVNTISEKSIQFFQVVSNLPKACLTGTKKSAASEDAAALMTKWWAGMDSNHRNPKMTDLQSVPFNHSGTYP